MDEIYKDLIAYNTSKNITQDFHMEAIKCQVIVERTNIYRDIIDNKFQKKSIENLDIDSRIYDAIDDTKNLVIMIKDNPIIAYYHLCCAGQTEDSENVLNRKIDYLRSVSCEECRIKDEFNKEIDVDVFELENKLGTLKNYYNDFSINNMLNILERNDSLRVSRLLLFNKEINGCDILKIIDLDSLRFYFKPTNIKFYIKGIGHGLGLCQIGANEKAKNGWNYKDIIQYYYTNVSIKESFLFDKEKPLKNKVIFLDAGHGGLDFGNENEYGLKEKDINLNIVLKLKEELINYGANVVLSRDCDEDKSLYDRVIQIKKIMPNLLLSIHINKSKFESISGVEGFFYWGDKEGEKLGEKIINHLCTDMDLKNRGIKEGNFYILKESGCSGIYLELGYISNIKECKNFEDMSILDGIAKNISKGILEYYDDKILTL